MLLVHGRGADLFVGDERIELRSPAREHPVRRRRPRFRWEASVQLLRVADLRAVSLRARFEASGATSLLVCPAADVQKRIVGAIFILWDGADTPPTGSDLKALMAAEQHIGAQIAAVLDLQGPPWPSKVHAGE